MYRAPEIIRGREVDVLVQVQDAVAVDLFSMGCTLFFVLTDGREAFAVGGTGADIVEHNTLDSLTALDDVSLSSEAVSVLSALLARSPFTRPAICKVLEHPLFWTVEQKFKYLGEVGNVLPVRKHKSTIPFIAEIEEIADSHLGEYNELDPEHGGSWARMLDSKYPLGAGGWGKQLRPPEDEERMYHIYGLSQPSKRQQREREGLVAAGKPLGGHEAKQIRMVGLLKMTCNFDAHGTQHVKAGRAVRFGGYHPRLHDRAVSMATDGRLPW